LLTCSFFIIEKLKDWSLDTNIKDESIPFGREVKKECIVFSKFYVKSKFVSRILLRKRERERERERERAREREWEREKEREKERERGTFLKMTDYEFDNDSHGLK